MHKENYVRFVLARTDANEKCLIVLERFAVICWSVDNNCRSTYYGARESVKRVEELLYEKLIKVAL